MPEFSANQLINPDFNSDFNQAALQGVQRQKEVGGLNALQGVNLNDPQSVSNAVGNSIKSGNLEQASALMGVNIANTVNTKILPGYLAKLQGQQSQQAQQPQPQQSQAPDPQHMADTMSMAKQAVDGLLQLPQEQRSQAFEQIKAQMQARGVPDAAIDSAVTSKDGSGKQDLGDENLKGLSDYYGAHAQHFNAHAQGQSPDASQLPTQQGTPWYKSVSEDPYLNDPMMQGILKKYLGIDVEPQLSRAAQLAMPEITETAKQNHAFNISQAEAAGKVSPELLEELGKTNIKNANESMDIYLAGSTQPQTVTRAQAITMANNGIRFGDKPEEGAQAAAQAHGTIQGEVGPGKNLVDKQNLLEEEKNLTDASQKANTRLNTTQYDDTALTAKQIIGLGNSIGTGVYTKDLSDLAQKFSPLLPQSHLAQYATNATLLSQDLSKAMKAQFAGSALPRIASEFNTITKAVPSNASPQDTVKLYGALMLAKNNMEQDADRHLTQYQQNPTNGRSQTAAVGEFDTHRPDLLAYALPELQKMTINGKPAVEVRKFPDGTMRGMFLPGSKNSVQFYIGRTQ